MWPFSLVRTGRRKKQQTICQGGLPAPAAGGYGGLSRVKRVLGDGAPERAR